MLMAGSRRFGVPMILQIVTISVAVIRQALLLKNLAGMPLWALCLCKDPRSLFSMKDLTIRSKPLTHGAAFIQLLYGRGVTRLLRWEAFTVHGIIMACHFRYRCVHCFSYDSPRIPCTA